MSSSEPRLAAAADALLTELPDGQAVLLHLGTKIYYTLNPTALEAWRAIAEGGRDVDAVVARVVDRFDVAPDVAARDVARLLEELRSARLLAE